MENPSPLAAVGSSTCTVPDCDRRLRTRGLCVTHYKRWRLTGETGGPIAARTKNQGSRCSVDDCNRPARERGWCRSHYYRWYRTGETPSGAVAPMNAMHETVSYKGAHARVVRLFGVASRHPCLDCGATADDWSYDNRDPEELKGYDTGRLMAYSLDVSRYQPRCRQCHSRYDALCAADERPTAAAVRDRTHCIHGHQMTPANTYTRKSGAVVCKRCRADGMSGARQ